MNVKYKEFIVFLLILFSAVGTAALAFTMFALFIDWAFS